jgi:hypothetical protein
LEDSQFSPFISFGRFPIFAFFWKVLNSRRLLFLEGSHFSPFIFFLEVSQFSPFILLVRKTYRRRSVRKTGGMVLRRWNRRIIGRAVPLQAWGGPQGSRKLRQRHRMVVRLSALRTGRIYLPGKRFVEY